MLCITSSMDIHTSLSSLQSHVLTSLWSDSYNRQEDSGSILSVESNQNVDSKTKNVESKTEKCGVQNSIFTSRNQLF